MDKHSLIVDSVVVRFGDKTVLSGGYITSSTGMVTGLLGRNGAGKSCMFRALMGGLRVENVMVSIDGKPVDRRIIGKSIKSSQAGKIEIQTADGRVFCPLEFYEDRSLSRIGYFEALDEKERPITLVIRWENVVRIVVKK